MNLIPIKRPPSDLAERLRELADLADDGRLTDAVLSYICDDKLGFIYAVSLNESLIMSTVLQQNCIDRMRMS